MEETNNRNIDIKSINEKIEKESSFIDLLTLEINKIIVGQKRMVESHLQHWSAPRCRRAIDRLIEAEQQSRHGISSQTAAAQALTALAIAVKR